MNDDTHVTLDTILNINDILVATTNIMHGGTYHFFIVHSFIKASGKPRLQKLEVDRQNSYLTKGMLESGSTDRPIIPTTDNTSDLKNPKVPKDLKKPKAVSVTGDGYLKIKCGYSGTEYLEKYDPNKIYQSVMYYS